MIKKLLRVRKYQVTPIFGRLKTTKLKKRIEQLSEIKQLEVKKQFPNTVVINVRRIKKNCLYFRRKMIHVPVLENGKILEKNQSTDIPLNAPILFSFTEDEALKEMIKAIGTAS